MKIRRWCPYCRSKVSFWSVFNPGLWKDNRIKCNACGKVISEYWEKIDGLVCVLVGFAIVGFVETLDSAWYFERMYLVLFFVVLALLAYVLVPVKRE